MELLNTNLKPANFTQATKTLPAKPVRKGFGWFTLLAGCTLFLLIGLGVGFWTALQFFVATPSLETTETITKQAEAATLDDALALIRTARVRFKDVKDYTCVYLRDEMIDEQLQMNTMNLKIRHKPFSVLMEWQAPAQKRGRRVAYVDGQNKNKMLVKQLITLHMDPAESIKKKESRHTIKEAGIQNLIDRYEESWEREKGLGQTKIEIEEKVETIKIGEKSYTRHCQVVTSRHTPDSKTTFDFFIAKVYFDKETGLPIRTECYDYPTTAFPEGRLVERYTYLDLKMNCGLTDADFSVK